VSDIDGLPLPIARAALEHGIRLVGDGGEIDAYHEPIDAAYEEITTTRERGHRSPISRLATGAI